MSNSYTEIAKRNNQPQANYIYQQNNRGSVYPIENEYEEVIVNNNLRNIKGIQSNILKSSHVTNTSRENSILTGLNNFNNISNISTRNVYNNNILNLNEEKNNISQFSSGQSFNLIPLKRDSISNSNYSNNNVSNQNIYNNNHLQNKNLILSPIESNNKIRNFSNNNNYSNSPTKSNFNNFKQNLTPRGITTPNNKSVNAPQIQTFTPQQKKINKSFDFFLKPPIKKGIFSQPKSNQLVSSAYKEVSTITNNLTAIDNSSQNFSRNFSEKYQFNQLNRNPSTSNLTNKSVNLVDDSQNQSQMSLKKNDSSSSINFNKYKVGSNISSNAQININDNHSNSNLFVNNSDMQHLFKKGQIDENVKFNNESSPIKDKYHTFSNNDKKEGNNITNQNMKSPIKNNNDNSYYQFSTTPNKSDNKNSTNGFFKNKPKNEKESRRMIIEMIKMKIRENSNDIQNEMTIYKILDEMKINRNIIDKYSNYSLNASQNSTFMANQSAQLFFNSKMNNTTGITSDPYLSGSVEIKNNNFEINNNYFGNINNVSTHNNNINNVLKNVPNFIYNMDENSQENINLICYLITPRILKMNIVSINSIHRVTFLFQLSPTNMCHVYGMEHYVFQWSDINTLSTVGTVDMLKIMSCSMKNEESVFILETMKDKSLNPLENDRYEIVANNQDECKLYVNALNYLSQLIKCKAYAFKGNMKINK